MTKALVRKCPPMTLEEIRAVSLEAAGFTPESVGELVRQGMEKLVQKLSATKTTRISFEGKVTETYEDDDTNAQIIAAKALVQTGVDIAGMKMGKSQEHKAEPTQVTVDLSGWVVTAPPKEE